MGQIELFDHLTVLKQVSSGSFKNNVTYHLFTNHIYLYEQDLALNNLEGFMYHQNKTNHHKSVVYKQKC